MPNKNEDQISPFLQEVSSTATQAEETIEIPLEKEEVEKPHLKKIRAWYSESDNTMTQYWNRWAKNTDLIKGRFPEDERTKSKVRNRSKLFFRKIWAAKWRFKAAMYSLFYRDPDMFTLEPRGSEDYLPVKILQKVVEYRRDWLIRKQNLFLQFDWAMGDIHDYGMCIGKLHWKYNPATNEDHPEFTLYPIEQVRFDMTNPLPHKRRFIIFINYLSKEDMQEAGYKNIDKCVKASIPYNILRAKRYEGNADPNQMVQSETEYPTPGKYNDDNRDNMGEKYEVWEAFYKEDGKWHWCVSNAGKVELKEADIYLDGNISPEIIGMCLTEEHKAIGEGFPESLEGPQESLNANINMRKDNVALLLNRPKIVDRFSNVDLHSLLNVSTGKLTMADNAVTAVRELDMADVTGSAYAEANADEAMMEEMNGITDIKQGQSRTDKATVAQLNYSESNAKIDYYGALIGYTFFKTFYEKLSYYVTKLESDETILRITNENLGREGAVIMAGNMGAFNVEYDCIVNVGSGLVGRSMEVQNTLLAMDRALMANQMNLTLLTSGALPPGTPVKFIDPTVFLEDLLPKIGKKNVDRFFYRLPAPMMPPPEMAQGGGGQANGQAGMEQPQMNLLQMPMSQNDLQAGGSGGF